MEGRDFDKCMSGSGGHSFPVRVRPITLCIGLFLISTDSTIKCIASADSTKREYDSVVLEGINIDFYVMNRFYNFLHLNFLYFII
jgi:hypothetical protein